MKDVKQDTKVDIQPEEKKMKVVVSLFWER